ncbi:J domain-containing protein [Pontibacter harenae]|uniref:J domain-containing protein n=1 Tax=Pontibacter harenae TaxID=2894083 RepID=UPI001E49D1E8|nr:DnaJ domain-containing protein [Pontibacter harenae]MCC9165300.1 DnaJ domain-containing protein [Pontibacter harenae]
MEQNFYTILGISSSATTHEIKLAYKKLALQYHPDRNPGDAQSEERFKLVNTAYQTLSDAGKRAIYDMKLQILREQSHILQQQAYQNARYYQTRPPASVSERHYRNIPRQQKRRFSRKDWYITVAFVGGILLFSFLLKVTMDYISGEENYKSALTFMAEGKYSSAHSFLTDAIHFQPDHAEAYLTRASIEMNVYENYEAAVRDLNQAIALQENVAGETYFMRGKCLSKLSRYKMAERDFSQALQKDSTLHAVYLQRGEVRLFYLKEYKSAIEDLTKYLKHNKGGEAWATALTYRGFGYYKIGAYALSETDYKRVLAADANNGRVYYLLGRTELEQELNDTACEHFVEAYRLGYSAAMLEMRANCL